MRWSVTLMLLGLLGILVGAAIVGRAWFGLAVVADSMALVAFGLYREIPSGQQLAELERRRELRRQAA